MWKTLKSMQELECSGHKFHSTSCVFGSPSLLLCVKNHSPALWGEKRNGEVPNLTRCTMCTKIKK